MALGACALLPCAARGQDAARADTASDPRRVQPERPTVATHAGTVAPGYAELETGVERDRAGDGSTQVSVPNVLKIGLAPRVQLSLVAPFAGGTGVRSGLGDAAVGVKWRFLQNRPLLSDVAVLPQLKLPTGGDRGTRTTDVSVLLIDSRTIGPVALDVNVGATRRSGDGTSAPRWATLWTASFGGPLLGALGWVFETYGYPGTSGPAGDPPIVAVLAGPTLAASRALVLDAGIITPVAGPQPHAVYAGLTTNLGSIVRRRR
jgi:hypothetical protein